MLRLLGRGTKELKRRSGGIQEEASRGKGRFASAVADDCAPAGGMGGGEGRAALDKIKTNIRKLAMATPCESLFPKIGNGDAL